MDAVLSLLVVGGLIAAGSTVRLRADRRARDAARDDTRRVGDAPGLDPADAAVRAGGKAAWMRPSGF